MAVTNIIKISKLEQAKRIDAEFYHPEKVNSKKILEKIGTKKIKDCFYNIRRIFDPQRHSLSENAFVFDLSDVKSFFLGGGKIANRSEEVGSTKKIFSENDVLISRLRPYLKEVSFVGFNGRVKLGSTEFIVLRQKNQTYHPEVLFSFLISQPIQDILLWSITGTEHPRFQENYLLNLKMPHFSGEVQSKIKELVRKAWEFFSHSQSLYSQAQNLLLEELGLKDFKPEEQLSYVANLSEVKNVHRIDAEYYKPEYKEIVEILERSNFDLRLLKNAVNISKKKTDPTQKPNKTFAYIELANVNPYSGEIEDFEEVIGHKAPSRARMILKKNDVLVSSLSGSLDNIALVPEELDGSIGSTGFFVISSDLFYPEFLFMLFKSDFIKKQLEQKTGGTIMTAVSHKNFENILVPIIAKETQIAMVDLIRESFRLREESKSLIEKAKQEVEQLLKKQRLNRL